MLWIQVIIIFNYFSAIIFHPLEVVSRYRDPQLQVGKGLTSTIINNPLSTEHDYIRF